MTSSTLVYDDDCGICTRTALFVSRNSGIEIIGFSGLTDELRAQLPADFEQCAHLVTDGKLYSCGEAMERAYEHTGLPPSSLLPLFRRIPGYELLRERVYRSIANNRPQIGRLLR